ncbi:hypothetical protein [Streptomyces agglomeratus]|uniref:hypothetical protein n=1 Tax=Streptomyces agglomeratus TaxID=285458 RepID=UPI00159F1E5D|nr:hypothetical protein [Streptomyces agglomeratus]
MTNKQESKQSGRMCTLCGHTSGRRRICNQCSPRRSGQPHADKYGTKHEQARR